MDEAQDHLHLLRPAKETLFGVNKLKMDYDCKMNYFCIFLVLRKSIMLDLCEILVEIFCTEVVYKQIGSLVTADEVCSSLVITVSVLS